MKYIYKLVCVFCAIGFFTSCDDILETDSELVMYEKDNTLKNPTDSVYSVMGIIGKMQNIADRVVLLGEIRGDLLKTTDAANSDLKRLADFDFSQENKYNSVSDYYAVINNCNYFLHHVDTTLERRGHKIFKAEYAVVKAFRAWTYLQLAQAYGNVPLITKPLLTEIEAREAMNQQRTSLADICAYFINDIAPYADEELPRWGGIGSHDSQKFFIPVKALLGDLCLWAGRYEEAARWYHDYLSDRDEPITLGSYNRSYWLDTEFKGLVAGYSVVSNTERISYIPMEARVFDGVVSDIPNIYNSTRENNYYYQVIPSAAVKTLSASQVYCMEYKTDTETDTLYAPTTGFNDDMMIGDLRLYSLYSLNAVGGQDEYSEYSNMRQNMGKITSSGITTYRRTMVYLRYAEALNRAGLPQSAFAILKYGICADNIALYVDSIEQDKAAGLIDFDKTIFTKEGTTGIHSFGSGDSQANAYYVMPQPADSLATYQDTVDYQMPLVEDMIINEMALEGAFEGYRYYDLMRVALRRGDAAYLAEPVAKRNGETDDNLRQLLMNTYNWYLPLP